jgi:predicted AAA+ superfamily ATPase
MERDLTPTLVTWKNKASRKPLLLNGARQVGKTFLVRKFGQSFPDFLEINFERTPEIAQYFKKDLDPKRIVSEISLHTGRSIKEGQTLLFLDEIQSCEEAITALRYFYEEMPGLHVIAAGSLLEFTIERVGVPVGRIETLYLYPMSLMEFMSAKGQGLLKEAILENTGLKPFSDPIHRKAMNLFHEYMAVGGMPEAVNAWVNDRDLPACAVIHKNIVENYRKDFLKYAKKRQVEHLALVMEAIPRLLGKKFVYSSVSREHRSKDLFQALDLLSKANVAHRVTHSSGNGVPLGAEENPQLFKALFADVALAQTILGLDAKDWCLNGEATVVNRGAITEAFAGQELLTYSDPTVMKKLHYWVREKVSGNAEVDYLDSSGPHVLPIEVKSGATGRLKSLHLFLQEKKSIQYGFRFSAMNYGRDGQIISMPLYAIAALGKTAGILLSGT